MNETESYAANRTKSEAIHKLKELIQVCPQIISPNIGIEAYLLEFDKGVKWIIDNGYSLDYNKKQ